MERASLSDIITHICYFGADTFDGFHQRILLPSKRGSDSVLYVVDSSRMELSENYLHAFSCDIGVYKFVNGLRFEKFYFAKELFLLKKDLFVSSKFVDGVLEYASRELAVFVDE